MTIRLAAVVQTVDNIICLAIRQIALFVLFVLYLLHRDFAGGLPVTFAQKKRTPDRKSVSGGDISDMEEILQCYIRKSIKQSKSLITCLRVLDI